MVPSPRFYDRNRNAPGLVNGSTQIILARMPAARKFPDPATVAGRDARMAA